ncbi:MAG: hypothetical protein AAB456_04310 [Patescibacteria group bacterium]
MHERFKFEKRPWYANLREGETFIWNRFIEKYPDAYDEVIYNQHLGSGAEIPEETPENIARDFKLLTQYKIDVVGFKNDKTDIIEIKPYAGSNAIGQVISYQKLFLKYINPAAAPNLVILTDQLRPDTQLLAEQLNIKLIIV